MNKHSVIFKKVNCEPRIIEVDNTLEAHQELVEGNIEIVALDSKTDLVLNEEGKIYGLPINGYFASDNRILDCIAGNYFICGHRDGEFISITDRQIKKYLAMANDGVFKV